jgi:hypothetical protein
MRRSLGIRRQPYQFLIYLCAAIRELQAAGVTSLWAIADALNERGISTPRGGQWQAGSVGQLLARIGG